MTTYFVDPTDVAFTHIAECVPEHRARLEEFWEKYAVCFKRVDGKTGIVLNANKHRVQFTCKDLQVMWLLGFALWKSIELFSPALLVPNLTGASSSSVLALDDDLDDIELAYSQRMAAVVTLISAVKLDPERWPDDIPLPVDSRDKLLDSQDFAAFDLVMMAISVLFLHELKHVEFHAQHDAGIPRPEKPAEEELQCDLWARDWFISDPTDYAHKSGHSYQEVYSKRAMALLLVCEYLRLAEQYTLAKRHASVVISNDYPTLAQRIDALSGAISPPDDDNYWVFSACILLAETRRQGKDPSPLDDMSSKEITENLIDVLTS